MVGGEIDSCKHVRESETRERASVGSEGHAAGRAGAEIELALRKALANAIGFMLAYGSLYRIESMADANLLESCDGRLLKTAAAKWRRLRREKREQASKEGRE